MVDILSGRVYPTCIERSDAHETLAWYIYGNRKTAGLTQAEIALCSGLGLRFVRELEQGKETVRMDKVNIALAMFDRGAVPGRKEPK